METLIKFSQFVDEITAQNGRLYKEAVLKKYENDEDIKYYLNFIFNPYVVTGISDKKLARFHQDSCIDTYPDVNTFKTTKDALEYLKEHNTGTYETLDLMFSYYMRLYIYDCKPLFKEAPATNLHGLFEKIISKNLILGIDAKSINKIIPNLVPTFNMMLANKYFDKPENIKGKKFAITTKIDGMRCIALKENGKVSFWSRQGQEITGLVDLERELLEKLVDDDICLDGELVAISDNPDTYKQTMKLARTKDVEKHGLKMKVFDLMKASEFKAQYCPDVYATRRNSLLAIFAQQNASVYISKLGPGPLSEKSSQYKNRLIELINADYAYFELLPVLYEGYDTSKIIELLNEQTVKGEEGIMLNLTDALYAFTRTNSLLKVKKFLDTEVKIVGFEPGINKLSDTLGTLICDYDGNRLGIGSGFTDEERQYIWTHQNEFLGKFAKVKYFEETTNADGGRSLRFPIWLGLRLEEDLSK